VPGLASLVCTSGVVGRHGCRAACPGSPPQRVPVGADRMRHAYWPESAERRAQVWRGSRGHSVHHHMLRAWRTTPMLFAWCVERTLRYMALSLLGAFTRRCVAKYVTHGSRVDRGSRCLSFDVGVALVFPKARPLEPPALARALYDSQRCHGRLHPSS